MLDKLKPYGTIYGDPDAMFIQDGIQYNAAGTRLKGQKGKPKSKSKSTPAALKSEKDEPGLTDTTVISESMIIGKPEEDLVAKAMKLSPLGLSKKIKEAGGQPFSGSGSKAKNAYLLADIWSEQ